MDEANLRSLIEGVRSGATKPDDAVRTLKRLPYADLGFAKIDHHRHLRQALPEAIYAPGKTAEHCVAIVGELLANGDGPVLLSRANDEQATAALAAHPEGVAHGHTLIWRPAPLGLGTVAVITAGTADLPVAVECTATLTAQGVEATLINDVGVAGIHRLLASLDELDDVDLIVVVAGMEGALASVIGGIAASPVIAVPTSVGYGASFQGVTALLGMLASCASGITVVGIDNGFGAACAAARILHLRNSARDES